MTMWVDVRAINGGSKCNTYFLSSNNNPVSVEEATILEMKRRI